MAETKSKFSMLFQVMDHGLINSNYTNFRHYIQYDNKPKETLIITKIFKVEFFYVTVNKLRVIYLQSPISDHIFVYNGPVVEKSFKMDFYPVMKLTSFQCFILILTNLTASTTGSISYTAMKIFETSSISSIKIGEKEHRSQNLSTILSQYKYIQLCLLQVSFNIF